MNAAKKAWQTRQKSKKDNSHLSPQRAYQARHRKQGLCTICPRPAIPNRQLCFRHRRNQGIYRQWTEQDRRELVRLWNQGEPVRRIVKHLHLKENTHVYSYLTVLRRRGYHISKRSAGRPRGGMSMSSRKPVTRKDNAKERKEKINGK